LGELYKIVITALFLLKNVSNSLSSNAERQYFVL